MCFFTLDSTYTMSQQSMRKNSTLFAEHFEKLHSCMTI
jgi:hypothetical protein